MSAHLVVCEQHNVNDDSYMVLEVLREAGSYVQAGDLVLVLDSSKASIDIESDFSGYFYPLVKHGSEVQANESLFVVGDNKLRSADLDQIKADSRLTENAVTTAAKEAAKVTDPARRLIAKFGLSLEDFQEDIITESVVLGKVDKTSEEFRMSGYSPNQNCLKRIAFIGAGGGFTQCLDVALKMKQWVPTAIYDNTASLLGQKVHGVPVAGSSTIDDVLEGYQNGLFDEVIVTVSSNLNFRRTIFGQLQEKNIPIATLVHPDASIGIDAHIGVGSVVFAQVTIGPCAKLGDNTFVSAMCNIEHHCCVGDHCTFGPGVIFSGSVHVGHSVKFGTGIFIEPRLQIGSGSIIASGCNIQKQVPDNVVAFMKNGVLKTKPAN